jgi:TolB-like protein/tetratricopeptide (TPR) repeat protein
MIQLGTAVFDSSAQMLLDSTGAKIALRAQTVRVLEHLIKANGALVTKDQLVSDVWANLAVTDDSLVQCIGEIRTAIGDTAHEILQTERRRGYRLLATRASSTIPADPTISPTLPAISTQNTDGQITPAIAVMAFTSMDGDERSERLAMTFAGDLITELARHKELRVIGRFSSFSLKGQALSSKEVCDKLNARYIVSGQVQFTETTIQWSLEMMDGHNDEIMWTERKQVKFTDLFAETAALNGRIAGTIYQGLNVFTWRKAIAGSPDSLNAYDLCARVSATGLTFTIKSMREAQQLATQATALYPNYARAWRATSLLHLLDITNYITGEWTDAQIPQALKVAHKAIELDTSQALVHSILANLLIFNGQHTEALLSSQHAMELGPSDPGLLNIHAAILVNTGRFAEAKKLSEALIGISPIRLPMYLANYGRILLAQGKHLEAIIVLQEALVATPGVNIARAALIVALEETGQHTDAAKHYHLLLANSNGFNKYFLSRRWDAIPELLSRFVTAFQAHGMEAGT